MREVGENLFRASLFLGGRRRMADENLVAARRCTRPLHIVGAGNRNAADAFEVGLHVVAALPEQNAFRHHGIFLERRSNRVRACLHRQADLEDSPRRTAGLTPVFMSALADHATPEW